MNPEKRRLHVPCEVRRISPARRHFFFGYYDKFPTNAGDSVLLALEAPFIDRLPTPDDPVQVGWIALDSPETFRPLAESRAWCWQQANMVQWLPEAADRLAIWNDRRDRAFVAVVCDVRTGKIQTVLPRPIYTLHPQRPTALSLNFSRVYRARPGYGYPGVPDPYADVPAPEEDGVWAMDLHTGNCTLVLSIAQMARLEPTAPTGPDTFHWVNHIQIAPTGERFACLHRYRAPGIGRNWVTRLITADMDGRNPRLLAPGPMVSHYDWFDGQRIFAWASPGPIMPAFYLIDDRPRPHPDCPIPFLRCIAPDILRTDGHCNFSPDRRFFANDTYPGRDRRRTLMLVRWPDGPRIDLARFYAPPELDGETRSDLHPNWFRRGDRLCVDSAHEGFRGMYVVDVSRITRIDANAP